MKYGTGEHDSDDINDPLMRELNDCSEMKEMKRTLNWPHEILDINTYQQNRAQNNELNANFI